MDVRMSSHQEEDYLLIKTIRNHRRMDSIFENLCSLSVIGALMAWCVQINYISWIHSD